jgi:hypothetical protein
MAKQQSDTINLARDCKHAQHEIKEYIYYCPKIGFGCYSKKSSECGEFKKK